MFSCDDGSKNAFAQEKSVEGYSAQCYEIDTITYCEVRVRGTGTAQDFVRVGRAAATVKSGQQMFSYYLTQGVGTPYWQGEAGCGTGWTDSSGTILTKESPVSGRFSVFSRECR